MGYLNHKYLYQGYSKDILFQSARGPCCLGSLVAAPSGPGSHSPLRTILCHCDVPLLSLSHRQAPQTRFAPPKLRPQSLVDLMHVASLPARLVGCICHWQPMWKPGAPVLAEAAELVWDGRSRVAQEEEGHQGHAPQHIGDKAHIQNGRG